MHYTHILENSILVAFQTRRRKGTYLMLTEEHELPVLAFDRDTLGQISTVTVSMKGRTHTYRCKCIPEKSPP